MQSRISCFNKTLFLKNLTRFWPFAVIYTLINIISHPVTLYLRLNASYNRDHTVSDKIEWIREYFSGIFYFDSIVIFIMAIVIAMAVLSYLYQSRSAFSIHAFPVTRTELFVSNYLSGLVLIFVPQLLTALITNLVLLGDVNQVIPLVWKWLGSCVVYSIFFYSFACFVSMFTGQLLAAPLFYLIWNFVYYAVVFLIDGVAAVFVYGLDDMLIDVGYTPLSPLPYLMGHVRLTSGNALNPGFVGGGVLVGACIASLVLTGAAWIVYQKRHIEGAGDFITVAWAKPLFRWAVGIMGALAGALFMVILIGDTNYEQNASRLVGKFLIYMLFFGAAFFVVAEMFIEKSFKVFRKKVVTECAVCIGILFVFCGMLHFDIFGLETYVPQAEEVGVACLSGDGLTTWVTTEEIEKITKLHESLLAQRKQLKECHIDDQYEGEGTRFFNFEYYMKNGKKVNRYYLIPGQLLDIPEYAALVEAYDRLALDPEANKRAYFGYNYEEMDWQVREASLYYSEPEYVEGQNGVENAGDLIETYEQKQVTIMDTRENMQKLYEAVLLDIEEGHVYFNYYNSSSDDGLVALDAQLDLELSSAVQADGLVDLSMINIPAGAIYSSDQETYCETRIDLNRQCTHIIDTLIELGVIDSIDQLQNLQ